MKVLELFAGTRCIGKAFEKRGHEVFSVEWDKDFENIDLYEDIGQITAEDILEKFGHPDVIWASPDCATYSIARIWTHRKKNPETGELEPISDYAKFCDEVNQHVLQLIKELSPKYYFIENPRGGMRKMSWMQELPRYTVTYCQYGDKRMKPTDIWTNYPRPNFKPPCRNGDTCHEAAPRGSTYRKMKRLGYDMSFVGGTAMGLRNARERSKIPDELCEYIVDICEGKVRKDAQMEWRIIDGKIVLE
jgi:site-specific DNA-cytosine methylase